MRPGKALSQTSPIQSGGGGEESMWKRHLLSCVIATVLFPCVAMATGMMERLAEQIVKETDSCDRKMHKIENWVRGNIEYVSDQELFGREDATYHPSVTIRKGRADCEDGAFLTQSLAAYAGIPLRKVRTVIGMTVGKGGRSSHAWTLYKREEDDTWVVVDWTREENGHRMSHRPAVFLDPDYRDYRIIAYVVIRKKWPFRASYVQIAGDVPLSRLGLPGELDRLLAR